MVTNAPVTVRAVGTVARHTFDVVVLTGGKGRRLGGVDKASLSIGGTTLLDRVLRCTDGARQIVVVGPERPTAISVTWTREEPPGSGPVAGIAAGIAALPRPIAPTVVVLATDLPHLTVAAVRRLVAQRDGDGVVYIDAERREQPLCAAYDSAALMIALDGLPAVTGASVRSMLAPLHLRLIHDDSGVTRDVDTPDDLSLARARTEAEPR